MGSEMCIRDSLGAALAESGPALSVSGDGGFLFACGELATAAQERIPLTAVVVDDGGYGMLRFDQDLKGDPHDGVDLHTPDFVAMARSFGVRADLAETDAEALGFLEAVERALPEDGVLVCDMCIPGYWLGGFHNPAGPRKLSYPLGWGTLGCAFPQGLGEALAESGPALSVSGDGGFLFACGELATAAQERLSLIHI